MSVQRRNGVLIKIHPTITTENRRGAKVKGPDLENWHEVRAWIVPDRSSRAELIGQQEIEVYRVGVDPSTVLTGVDQYSRVIWEGDDWDVVGPPAKRGGSRHVRHQTLTIRRRTPAGGA